MFKDAKIKATWASSMIRDIRNASIDFASKQRRQISVQHDTEDGTLRVWMASDPVAVPDAITLITGTCIQTMRSCLDYVTSEIWNAAKITDTRIHFPIDVDHNQLLASGSYKKVLANFPDLAVFIADSIKPTKAENFPLWAINRLANTDKHRNILLATVVDALRIDDIERSDEIKVGGIAFITATGYHYDNPLLISKVKTYSDPYATVHVSFAETDLIRADVHDGLELIETLSGFLEAVTNTIDAVEEFLRPKLA